MDEERRSSRRSPEEAYRYLSQHMREGGLAAQPRRAARRKVMGLLGGAAGLVIGVLLAELFFEERPPTTAPNQTGTQAALACLDPAGHLPGFVRQVSERIGAARPIEPVATRLTPSEGGWLATMRYRAFVSATDAGAVATAQARLDPRFCETMLVE